MLFLIASYLPSLVCGIHAVRTGRAQFWLWIMVIAPILGPIIYICAELVPEWLGGRTARRVGSAARQALDPERELRQARAAYEDTPTVGNQMRMAQAAAALGRWEESEAAWAQCVTGPYADDPVILLGHANALLELKRYDEALKQIEKLRALGKEGDTGPAHLALARAYEGLGRNEEADAPYRYAADRVPGLEAGARYVAFMANTGRKSDAEIGLAEIERRYSKIAGPLQPQARPWRDLAVRAVRS